MHDGYYGNSVRSVGATLPSNVQDSLCEFLQALVDAVPFIVLYPCFKSETSAKRTKKPATRNTSQPQVPNSQPQGPVACHKDKDSKDLHSTVKVISETMDANKDRALAATYQTRSWVKFKMRKHLQKLVCNNI